MDWTSETKNCQLSEAFSFIKIAVVTVSLHRNGNPNQDNSRVSLLTMPCLVTMSPALVSHFISNLSSIFDIVTLMITSFSFIHFCCGCCFWDGMCVVHASINYCLVKPKKKGTPNIASVLEFSTNPFLSLVLTYPSSYSSKEGKKVFPWGFACNYCEIPIDSLWKLMPASAYSSSLSLPFFFPSWHYRYKWHGLLNLFP